MPYPQLLILMPSDPLIIKEDTALMMHTHTGKIKNRHAGYIFGTNINSIKQKPIKREEN